MKKIFLFAALILMQSSLLFAQQMVKWPFNGKEISWVNPTNPTVLNTNVSVANPVAGATAAYQNDGSALFYILDDGIYSPSGAFLDNLYLGTYGSTSADMGDEILLFPENPSGCAFYAVYSVSGGANTEIVYNKITPNPDWVVTSHGVIEDISLEQFVGLAAGVYNESNGTRQIYLARSHNVGARDESISVVNYTLRNGGFTPSITFSYISNEIREKSELEVSPVNNVIMFGNYYVSNPSNDHYDFVTYFEDPFPYRKSGHNVTGVELNNDGKSAYVNYASGNPRIALYSGYIPGQYLQDNFVSQSVGINNCQIELARDGAYYTLKDNGDVWRINGSTATYTYMSIGSNAMIKNSIYSNRPNRVDYYMLPDQIDGAMYNETFTDPSICCSENVTSEFLNDMNNTVALVNDDIKVSGTNVIWTPTNNPFTTGSSEPEVYFRGNIDVEPGAKLTIQDMIIHFDEGKGINLTYATSGNGSKMLIEDATLTVYEFAAVKSTCGKV